MCMPAGGLCREKRPLFSLSPLQQDSHARNHCRDLLLKAWLAVFPKCLAAQQTPCLSDLTGTLPNEQRGWRGIAGGTMPPRPYPQQGRWLGALSQADTAPVGDAFLGGDYLEEQPVCSF